MAQLFGAKLRYLRNQRALTQVDLAQHFASQGHITALETGKEAPSLRLVLQIVRFFCVSTDYLLRDTIPVEYVDAIAQPPSSLDASAQLFGPKLRALRVQYNLTQGALAHQLGLRRHASISNLEAGRKVPSLDVVVQLAELFQITTDYLLRDDMPIETLDTMDDSFTS
jgi:DNA-binding XRE family transcriptional regulator